MSEGRRTAVAIALFAAVVCIFFGDVLFGGRVLLTCNTSQWDPWQAYGSRERLSARTYRTDSARTYLPRATELARSLRSGRLPLWNPYIFCGSPFLADPQSRVLYPVSLLLATTDPERALGYDAAIHFFIALLGMYLFLRVIGASALGRMVGAFGFGFSSFFFLRLGHPTFVASASWIPFFFYAYEKARRSEAAGGLLLVIFLSLGFLAGMPQVFLFGAAALVVYVGCDLVQSAVRRDGRAVVSKAKLLAIPALLTGLVISMQLVPFIEYLKHSQEPGFTSDLISEVHLWEPVFLVRSLAPNFFGNPVDGTSWVGVIRGPGHPYNTGFLVYGGVGGLLLGLSSLVFIRKSRHVCAFAIMLLLSVGAATSAIVLHGVKAVLPFAAYSQIDRVSVIACFALAGLAGVGLSKAWNSVGSSERRGFALVMCFLLAVMILGSAVFYAAGRGVISDAAGTAERMLGSDWFHRSGHRLAGWIGDGTGHWFWYEMRQIGRALAFGALALASVLLALRRRTGSRAAALAGVVLLATLVVDLTLTARTYYVSQQEGGLFETEGISRLRSMLGDAGRWRTANIDVLEAAFPSNIPQIFGIHMLNGTSALPPAGHAERLARAYAAGDLVPGMGVASGSVGGLMAVRYLVGARNESGPGISGLPLVYDGDMHIYENAAALPRGVCIDRMFLDRPFQRVPSSRGTIDLVPHLADLSSHICGQSTTTLYEPEKVVLDVHAEKACILVFQDTDYPGWEASIDGRRRPIERTDLGVRALTLEQGDHIVVMEYKPSSLRYGVMLSCLGLVLTVVYATKKAIRHKKRAG